MIDYNNYKTDDPFRSVNYDLLFESRGIPNILKTISKDILKDIISSNLPFSKIYHYDLEKLNADILIDVKSSLNKEIYATSQFGIYTPLGKKLKNCVITIWLNKDYSEFDLERVITHELLHIYEVYNRIIGGSKKDLQWRLINILHKIRGKYNNKLIKDLCYLIYLSTDQEINARVAETYSILIENKTINRDVLLNKLKLTSGWKYSEYLIDFDYKKYDIDYNELSKFIVELNTSIKDKFNNINFNIYRIPNSEKECRDILKAWSSLFKKKGIYFQSKLSKIIDEVINDVKMIESAHIEYNEDNILSDKYILKYDIFLERNSKLLKILR